MITFVVYDDKKEFRNQLEKTIYKLAEQEKLDYQIKSYGEYDEDFQKTIQNYSTPKIYLLDIDVPNSESGIDVAKKIRKNDWNSVIILITSHMDLGYEALKAKIMVLDYISKHHDWKANTIRTVKEALKRIGHNNVLILENGSMTHRIYLFDILYVVKDSVERKCIIKTVDGHSILVNKTLHEIGKMLDDRFYLSHRSCYINLERIIGVDWKKNTIYFEEGEKTDYLARNRKKGLKEYVGNHQ